MKIIKLLFCSLSLLFLCSLNHAAEIEVNVKPHKHFDPDEFALCIEKFNYNSGFYKAFDTIYISDKGHFYIDSLETGRYMIAVMHPSSEILLYNIFLPEGESAIHLDVQLDQVAISSQKINKIRLVGEFNNYNHWGDNIYLKYDPQNEYWFYPVDSLKQELGEFYFVINQNDKSHSVELPVPPKYSNSPWADYHNTIKPGTDSIIFNPAAFKRGDADPVVKLSGNCKNATMLWDSIYTIYSTIKTKSQMVGDKTGLADYSELYDTLTANFKTLKDKYKRQYNWIFPDIQYRILNCAPILVEQKMAYRNKRREKAQKLREKPAYIENMKDKALLLKDLEINERMLTPELVREAFYFGKYTMNQYGLYDELSIPYGYFNNFLQDVKDQMDDPQICGTIMHLKAQSLARNRPQKAQEIYTRIIEQYPGYSSVKDRSIHKELKGVKLSAGKEAPKFKIETFDGQEITLSSLKGKYVFLDFWGSWCAPCRGEIPHIKKLDKSFSEDELVVIGMVCRDNKEKVERFIEENEIRYHNAMVGSGIISDYGITGFPTTFLIDKKGKIVEKNLRGEALTERVKEVIQ